MSGGQLRLLSETQARSVLAAGGVLVKTAGRWRAHRSPDARLRAAGWVSPLITQRLEVEGAVCADPHRPERLIASPSLVPPQREALPRPACLLAPAANRQAASLFVMIAGGPVDASGEMIRLKAAAQRFLADMRLAAAGAQSSSKSVVANPAAALGRLADLEAIIGLNMFRQLECLLVEASSPAGFARASGLCQAEAPLEAMAALRALARAYDLTPR